MKFLIDRDPEMKFRFASLQSETAKVLLNEIGNRDNRGDTIIFIAGGIVYTRSRAILEIAKMMNGFWHSISYLRFLPIPFLDLFYKLIARYRYKIFGKKDQCMVPSREILERFL